MLAGMTGDMACMASVVMEALLAGGKVMLCGNGGCATIAEHIAGEIVGRFREERPGWPALALAADGSIVTALANDFGFRQVFARQVMALASRGDVVIGLSTSGSSANVVEALRAAHRRGAQAIAVTGAPGGPVADAADLALLVPSADTARIQEAQLLIGHIMCGLVEDALTASEQQGARAA